MFDLESLYKSLVRNVVETMHDVQNAGISPQISYYAWDSRNEEAELPGDDLIGLAGWTFRENKGLWMIHAGVTLSTISDENLFREIKIVDAIHNRWGEGCLVPMLDKDTGEEYTQLRVTEFELMPSGQSEKRNYRSIGLELLRTGGDA